MHEHLNCRSLRQLHIAVAIDVPFLKSANEIISISSIIPKMTQKINFPQFWRKKKQHKHTLVWQFSKTSFTSRSLSSLWYCTFSSISANACFKFSISFCKKKILVKKKFKIILREKMLFLISLYNWVNFVHCIQLKDIDVLSAITKIDFFENVLKKYFKMDFYLMQFR